MRWTALFPLTLLMLCSSAASQEPADESITEWKSVPELVEPPDGITFAKGPGLDARVGKFQESIRGGEEYKCYPSKQYQIVAHIIIDYRWLHGYALNLGLQIENKLAESDNLMGQMEAWKGQVTILVREAEFMSGLYDEEHKLRLKTIKGNKLQKTLLIVGNIVLGSAIVGLGIYTGVK